MNNRYNLIFTNIFLSLIFIYLVIHTVFTYYATNSNTKKKYTVNRVFTTSNKIIKKKQDYYKTIIDRNLFNPIFTEVKKSVPPPPPPVVKPEPKTEFVPQKPAPKPLNLKLKGTIVGLAENSFAIIEDTAKREDSFYRINDPIKGTTAKIIDIGRNFVTLQIEDRTENLYIYDEDKKNLSAAPTQKNKTQELNSDKNNSSAKDAFSTDPGKSFVVNRAEIMQSLGGGNIEQIAETIMTSVDINPYIENGKFVGYSLNNIESMGELLSNQGFKNGDVVKEVNGIKLESPEKLFELYQTIYPELQTLSSIQMVVSRNGIDTALNYSINQ